MSGSSESTGTTTPVYNTIGGATGDTTFGTSGRLFGQAENLTNQGPGLSPVGDFGSYGNIFNVGDYGSYGDTYSGVFSKSLEDAILRPQFGPDTASEQALLNSIMDVTAGRGAVSGLGAPTQASLATSIAPTLVDLRNKDIANLIAGREGDISLRGQDVQRNLGLRQQDVGMRGQDIERNLGIRGQDIQINAQQVQQWMAALQSLAELAGLSMPQTVVGSQSIQEGDSQSVIEDLFEGLNVSGW